jgi:hypothetical protein
MTKIFDPPERAIVAAAEALDREGHFYNWWPGYPSYKDQDSISKGEFEDIVYLFPVSDCETDRQNCLRRISGSS